MKSISLPLKARGAETIRLKSIIGTGCNGGERNLEAGQNRFQWRTMVLMASGSATIKLVQNISCAGHSQLARKTATWRKRKNKTFSFQIRI